MNIYYLFSKNKKIGSRIISWAAKYEKLGLEKLPSHAAVLLNEEIVIESTLSSGVRMVPYSRWKEINTQVAKIKCRNFDRPSKEVLEGVVNLWGKKYDWKGILYFGLSYLNLIIRGKQLPSKNKWENKDKYFCTEYQTLLSGIGDAMTSPAKMLKSMLDCGLKNEEKECKKPMF